MGSNRRRVVVGGVLAVLAVGGGWFLTRPSKPGAPSRRARNIVAALRAMPASPLVADWQELARNGRAAQVGGERGAPLAAAQRDGDAP